MRAIRDAASHEETRRCTQLKKADGDLLLVLESHRSFSIHEQSMKQFPKQVYLKIENDGVEDYMLIYDQMPLPAPGDTTMVGHYRLEEIIYSSKGSVKVA